MGNVITDRRETMTEEPIYVTITKKEYDSLLEDSKCLAVLSSAGVDSRQLEWLRDYAREVLEEDDD